MSDSYDTEDQGDAGPLEPDIIEGQPEVEPETPPAPLEPDVEKPQDEDTEESDEARP